VRKANALPSAASLTPVITGSTRARGRERFSCSLQAATHVVIHMAPTAIEYDRPNAAVDVINDAKNLRPDDDAETATLLSRAVPRDRHSRLSNRSL
jgi:hypothetical protein